MSFLLWIPFLQGHYATDTYNIFHVGYDKYATNWSFTDGRIFMGLIGLLQNKIQLPIEIYVSSLTVLALTVSCFLVVKFKNSIERYREPKSKWEELILVVLSYTVIFNFMYLENMYFVENFVMAISLLCFMIAAEKIVEKPKHYLRISLIFTIIGILCYQGTIGFLFVMTTLFTFLKNKRNKKQMVMDLFQSGIVALSGVIANLVTVKIMGTILGTNQTRLGGISQIWTNILYILEKTYIVLMNTCGLYPLNLFLLGVAILITISMLYEIGKEKVEPIAFKMLFLILITIASSSVTFLITLSSFYAGRLRFCIGALIGILFAFLYVETNWMEKKKIMRKVITICLFFYFFSNINTYHISMRQHKQVNQLEKQQVAQIEEKIEKYEKETNIPIKKIAIVGVRGQTKKTYFQEIPNYSVLTYNAVRCDWSVDGVIHFYTGRNLEKIEPTQEGLKIYQEKQQEELCIGDTLYIATYMY